MPSRIRSIVVGLSLAVVIALAGAPTASTQTDETARIDVPASGESVVGAVEVRGRAVTVDPSQFSFYRLYYGAGASAIALRPIGSAGEQPVEDGVLGVWDTAPLFEGEYLLQLTVYDTAGGTTTAQVVVNVLPAPTPTPLNQPTFVVVPGETPTPTEDEAAEDTAPAATPLPELPQLDPQIPHIDVPQQTTEQPPIPYVEPPPPAPGFQPIPIDPGVPSSLPPPLPDAPVPDAPPSFDPGLTSPPPPAPGPFNPVSPVGPPPVPEIAPYQPPPTLAPPPTPTTFGLP